LLGWRLRENPAVAGFSRAGDLERRGRGHLRPPRRPHLHGRNDLEDTIRRLQAYEKAGADVLFAPGLPDLAAVRAVVASLVKPVNFMVAIRGSSFSVAELAAAGVRRISLATSLYRAAMTGLADAAREIRESGTFGYVDRTMLSSDFAKYLKE
jgi:2-methylisocitrate lyase-like PEP mutase family enzyme